MNYIKSLSRTQVQKLIRQDVNVRGLKGCDFIKDKDDWYFMPSDGMDKPRAKQAEEIKTNQPDLDLTGVLYNYAAKGHKIELLGKEDINEIECYKLKITISTGRIDTYYISTTSYLIVRVAIIVNFNGYKVENTTDHSDYKPEFGIRV